MTGRRTKAAIDCNGYRAEMDFELARIGGEIRGSGYRLEMEHALLLVINGYYDDDAIDAFILLEETHESGWLTYLDSGGDVYAFNALQTLHLNQWKDWRQNFGLDPDQPSLFDDDDD